MNVIIQVCIGALPLLIAVAVYMIVKRKLLLPSILIGVELVCCVAAAIVFSGDKYTPIGDVEAIGVYESYKALMDGDVNEASDKVNEVFLAAGDKVEVTLAKARIYAAQGSWEEAVALYQKVMKVDDTLTTADEKQLVDDMLAGKVLSSSQLAYQTSNIAYLTSQGLNPADYGFMALTEAQIDENVERLDQFQGSIIGRVVANEIFSLERKHPVVKDIEKINSVVGQIMSYDYNTYIGVDYEEESGSHDEDIFGGESEDTQVIQPGKNHIKALNSRIKRYKKTYPELFKEKKYMEAYIFSEVIAENDLDSVWENGTPEEGEVIANMYVSGIITEENFSKEFTKKYKAIHKDVLKQCKKVAKKINHKKDIGKVYVDGKSVAEILTKLNEEDRFALHQMANDMKDKVGDGVVSADKLAHYYMSMSTVANKIGNVDEAKDYFNEAAAHSEESSDKEFGQVMNVIQDAYIEGDDLDYIDMAEQVADSYQESFYHNIVSDEVSVAVEGIAGSAMSETKAQISIGKIDVSKFDTVSMSVQYSGDVELKKSITQLVDCDIEIDNFKIEKRQYKGSKVVLLCDVSGSMDGSIGTLQEAVIRYIRSMKENEQVNIVLFSDAIDLESGFKTNQDELVAFAEQEIYVRGGTQIGNSTYDCLDQFTNGDVANTIIVMTDGEDNSPWSESRIRNEIGAKANNNNVYIYTIGVGNSIAQTYLESIAEVGSGEFLYCSNISLLEKTYQFIHERIENEYVITFEAEDLDSISRTVQIKVDDKNMAIPAIDSKSYKLKGEAVEEDDVEFSTELPEDITVKGLDINHIDKSTEKQLLKILGTGFKDAGVSNVYLESTDGKSNCKIKEVEDGSITFQVAPSVSEGTYSVFVTIEGRKYKVDRLVVGNPDESELAFGAYKFKADNIEISETKVVMTGNVVMNDYLYFDGVVTLTGNINKDSSVKLYTSEPAYVHHNVSGYNGVERLIFLNRAITKAFDSLSTDIFDDGANYNNLEEYKVEMSDGSDLRTLEIGFVSFEANVCYLYPNKVEFVSSMALFKDNPVSNLACEVIEGFQITDKPDVFKGEGSFKSMLMKEGPHVVLNVELEADLGDDDTSINFADFVKLDGSGSATLALNTYDGNFTIGFAVGTEDDSKTKTNKDVTYKQKGDAGLTVSLSGNRGEDKKLSITAKIPAEFTFIVYGVPVTISDFEASLLNYNITSAINDIKEGNLIQSKLLKYIKNKEGADLSVGAKIGFFSTEALPAGVDEAIETIFGDDISLVAIDELQGSWGLDYPHLGASGKVTVFEAITIAEMSVDMGAISYPDYITELLNTDSNDRHYGFTFTSKSGITFDWDALGADISGTVSATATLDDLLIGGYACGKAAANINVNIFGSSFKVDGEAKVEAYGAVWCDDKGDSYKGNDQWRVEAIVVASVDGTSKLTLFGHNIDFLEREIHEKAYIINTTED